MDPDFKKIIDALHGKLEQLLSSEPISLASPNSLQKSAGVYLFTKGKRHMYVGRTDNLQRRMKNHLYGKRNQSAFAVQLAIKKCKLNIKLYSPGQTWFNEEPFLGAFSEAKALIRKMNLRFIEEKNPVAQLILEVYVAMTLKTPYNHFGNT